ncbi:hypothetical protein ACE38V_18785 [Cytobacillus sp. Hz8]|uniref:hypothetical protein n=1 Tax=Cytobacillus sp. Hz8 TaxID=3347168 RepID=UPI0035DFE49D
MLFHYHFWTPYVEETERFYLENGFRISLRVGKYNGEFQTFNPPLQWEDFRKQNILFRIVEMRKGAVNITFGYGKKIMFDHIGYIVSDDELGHICDKAKAMNWMVNRGERRTFITTPYGFRIELQTHIEVVDELESNIHLQQLTLLIRRKGLENDLATLFQHRNHQIIAKLSQKVTIQEAIIPGLMSADCSDPNGVRILNHL